MVLCSTQPLSVFSSKMFIYLCQSLPGGIWSRPGAHSQAREDTPISHMVEKLAFNHSLRTSNMRWVVKLSVAMSFFGIYCIPDQPQIPDGLFNDYPMMPSQHDWPAEPEIAGAWASIPTASIHELRWSLRLAQRCGEDEGLVISNMVQFQCWLGYPGIKILNW